MSAQAAVTLISTARLDLVPGLLEHFEADMRGDGSIGRVLGAEMPARGDWPIEHWDENALRWCINKLTHAEEYQWWAARYVVLREGGSGGRRVLVGTCGMKGPPSESGEIEIGYGVVPSFRRRGIASEAAAGLVEWAWSQPRVKLIVGQTLAGDEKSAGVLLRNGFVYAGKGWDPTEENVVRYELRRAP